MSTLQNCKDHKKQSLKNFRAKMTWTLNVLWNPDGILEQEKNIRL